MAGRARNRRSNPLALAVLVLLYEQEMHPYQMSQTLRERHKDDSVRLNFGSLYAVVEALAKQDLIRAMGAEREGNRPARTVYALTDAGTTEVLSWMRDLVATPVKEYPQFMAALSFLAVLAPDEAGELLRTRCDHLRQRIALLDNDIAATAGMLPELFVIETHYEAAMVRAELAFAESLAGRIDTGALGGTAGWQQLHDRLAELGVTRIADADIESIAEEMGVSITPPQ
ncbi:PadR family transcriptional regulator [Aldersonia sp. NBC_00410]|uniref:PadR family transcriptional regulator n=1 Tax=Aldersonia sp. NBC_00410 TaxID=2975954 RepID=UPI002257EA50|nr:PadR family transcriptional regulator [Aldersonia sp. NBC_00410]MCX5043939.1 PadR family transcriptional regulator [Aldersonia sp. NBC_00410]